MEYINLSTAERLPLADLCIRANASIPSGHEFVEVAQVNGVDQQETWAPIRDVPPTAPAGSRLELQGVVKQDDGYYYYNYVVVADPAPVDVVPFSVSRFQARAALYNAGYLTQVETYMADANTPMLQKLAWQDAQVFERTSPTVEALGQLLALSSNQLDQLFIAASKITA